MAGEQGVGWENVLADGGGEGEGVLSPFCLRRVMRLAFGAMGWAT